MRHHIFKDNPSYPIAILIKDSGFKEWELRKHYIDKTPIPEENFIGLTLKYNEHNKCPVKLIKEHLATLLKAADSVGVQTLLVCDGSYFKTLTKLSKAEPHYGYIKPCAIDGYEHMNVVLSTNYQSLFYNPQLQEKIDYSLSTLTSHFQGAHIDPGTMIIHSEHYPVGHTAIKKALQDLHQYDELVVDTETFSLKLNECGLGTIGFSWDKHNGTAFLVDYQRDYSTTAIDEGVYGRQVKDKTIRALLKEFFENYTGKLTFHNANFDLKVLIYSLFMDDSPLDLVGMQKGIRYLTRDIDDTKIIAYLATNSTARNSLRLKDLALEFAGNYGQDDINDIRRIPHDQLLRYNLVDCLSTAYVKEKHMPTVYTDHQDFIYQDIMLPSIKSILQMELTGMPINMKTVLAKQKKLTHIKEGFEKTIFSLPVIVKFIEQLQIEAMLAKNLTLKVKVKPIEDFRNVTYNPASNKQTAKLLYDTLGMDIIDTTDTGQPAVGGKTLKKLLYNATDQDQRDILEALIGLAEVSIILNNFIANFIAKSFLKSDGMWYLHGSFNLGGTVSGRLSSSDPNMQNIPSTGTQYANDIKECFEAPSGWLMMGADFASLEDRISALTTKDFNKLRVYTDGFDGHSLRAYSYFKDKMPDIRQVTSGRTFKIIHNGTTFNCKSGDTVLTPSGKKMLVEDYYDKINKTV